MKKLDIPPLNDNDFTLDREHSLKINEIIGYLEELEQRIKNLENGRTTAR